LTLRAKKCLAERDYERAIRFLEAIPESARSDELGRILSKAIERSDDIAFLLVEIDEAVRLDDPQTALAKVERLERFQPRHPRIGEIRKQFRNVPRPVVPYWARQSEPSGFFRTTTTLPIRQSMSKRIWKEIVKFFVKAKANKDRAGSSRGSQKTAMLVVGLAVGVLVLAGIGEKVYRSWSRGVAAPNEAAGDTEAAFSRDGRWFVGRSVDGTIKIWDTESREETLTLSERGPLTSVAFSPDGHRIVSSRQSANGSSLTVWDASSGGQVVTMEPGGVRIWCAAFSPDAARIASGDESGDVILWDSREGTRVKTFKGGSAVVGGIAFCPQGDRIVTGHRDGTVRVWDSATGSTVATLKGHAGAVTSVAVSVSGKRAASGGEDNTVKVWDLSKEQAILTLRGHKGHVASVAFSPDGHDVASGGDDKTLKLWSATTGHERLTLTGHSSRVSCVVFSPDGRRILSGGNDQFSVYHLSDADN
jgi:WD40 repeat protein